MNYCQQCKCQGLEDTVITEEEMRNQNHQEILNKYKKLTHFTTQEIASKNQTLHKICSDIEIESKSFFDKELEPSVISISGCTESFNNLELLEEKLGKAEQAFQSIKQKALRSIAELNTTMTNVTKSYNEKR